MRCCVATGARAEEAIPGAITFGAQRGTGRFRAMLEQAERGEISRLVFAVPAQAGWPLALYELALLTAARLRAKSAPRRRSRCSRPSWLRWPCSAGAPAVRCSRTWRIMGSTSSPACCRRRSRGGSCAQGRAGCESRPTPSSRCRGFADPRCPGFRTIERGFIPVDDHGLVNGTTNVYAAGDAVAFRNQARWSCRAAGGSGGGGDCRPARRVRRHRRRFARCCAGCC